MSELRLPDDLRHIVNDRSGLDAWCKARMAALAAQDGPLEENELLTLAAALMRLGTLNGAPLRSTAEAAEVLCFAYTTVHTALLKLRNELH